MLQPVTDDTFEAQVLKADRPVLVLFWAAWAGPCNLLRPYLEELARRRANQLKVVDLDIEDNPMVVERYKLRALPTLLFLHDGEVKGVKIGDIGAERLQEWLDPLIPEET